MTLLLSLLLIFLPTQLGRHYFAPFSYISGVRIDYLAPTIYFTDFVIILIIITRIINVVIAASSTFGGRSKSPLKLESILMGLPRLLRAFAMTLFVKRWMIVTFTALIFINTAFSLSPQATFFKWVRIIELVLLYFVVKHVNISPKKVLTALSIGTGVEFLLAILQFVSKQSVQGVFYYLGERAMTLSTPDIAKVTLNGVEILRPYATFSHPNSMGGFYLMIYFFVLTILNTEMSSRRKSGSMDKGVSAYGFQSKPPLTLSVGSDVTSEDLKMRVLRLFILTTSTLLIFLSFSKIAIGTFLLLNVVYVMNNKAYQSCKLCSFSRIFLLAALALIFFSAKGDPLSYSKRFILTQNAWTIFTQHGFEGTGVGAYLYAQSQFPTKYPYFFLQPVHNIFLLALTELGVLGIGILLCNPEVLRRIFHLAQRARTLQWRSFTALRISQQPFFYLLAVIILTGMFDHYWLTLQQNMLVIPVVFGLLSAQQPSSTRTTEKQAPV